MDHKIFLKRLGQSEEIALKQFTDAVQWVARFHDPRSGFFQIAYSTESTIPRPEADPNSATCLVGGTIGRCREFETLLDERERQSFRGLREEVEISFKKLAIAPIDRVLPLRSFGILPLFSTSFLAQFLAHWGAPSKLLSSSVYLVPILRLLAEFSHPNLARYYDGRAPVHPYLLSHCWRALMQFKTLIEKSGLGSDDIYPALVDLKAHWSNVDQSLQGRTPARPLHITEESFCSALTAGHFVDEIIPSAKVLFTALANTLHALEELAVQAVNFEIAKSARTRSSPMDPAGLGFGLLLLSEQDPRKHASTIAQGLETLLPCAASGYFGAGKPFFSDEKGRLLLVPSAEIATATICIATNCRPYLPDGQVDHIYDVTEAIQNRLLEDKNKLEIDGLAIEGWSSDRASSPDRVESWVTVHVLEFFANRINFVRRSRKLFVLKQYNWIPADKLKTKWAKVQDPDTESGFAQTAKERIERALDHKTPDRVPMFLLYGPPGTSKTTLATALAQRQGWDLVRLSPSEFVADSLDRIEFQSTKIFEDLMNLDDCVVIFDEIDALFRDRKVFYQKNPGTIMEFVIPALLPKLQDFRDYVFQKNMAVFFLSNFYETIDTSISRSGRIDFHIPVLPYTVKSRREVAQDRFMEHRKQYELKEDATTAKLRFDAIVAELDKLPCDLVYRDLDAMMHKAAPPATAWAAIRLLAERPTVSASIYDHERRPDALNEFCLVVARLLGKDKELPSTTSAAQLKRFLKQQKTAFVGRSELDAWSEVWADWLHDGIIPSFWPRSI